MTVPSGPKAHNADVDLLVVGSGSGLATALYANSLGLKTLVVEASEYVGGSLSMSGGAFWVPGNHVLRGSGFNDTVERGLEYVESLVPEDAPRERWEAQIKHGPEAIRALDKLTDLNLFWSKGYSDYHPEHPGGASIGRTCEARPFNLKKLGDDRGRFHPTAVAAPFPMPMTGYDYKWVNLITKTPLKSFPISATRTIQGVGGMLFGKEYVATGQATAGGLFHAALKKHIPVWTRCPMTSLITDDEGNVTGAIVEQDGEKYTINTSRGVVLAGGGFDHNTEWRMKYQSESLTDDNSMGNAENDGDTISIPVEQVGAKVGFMDQAWWFPAMAPLHKVEAPKITLAERSLPGSFMIDQTGRRFINEAEDYMTFGNEVLAMREEGRANEMWIVFDQQYKMSYIFGSEVFPGMPLPKEWYEAGVAFKAKTPAELARKIGVPEDAFTEQFAEFNQDAQAGIDSTYNRGDSAYDKYYGDPTNKPNPNLRPLKGQLYAVKMVISDLGTCGGLMTDATGAVVREDDTPIVGLYAQGNNAANYFGNVYPGAGATIAQGLVNGYIIANHAAGTPLDGPSGSTALKS